GPAAGRYGSRMAVAGVCAMVPGRSTLSRTRGMSIWAVLRQIPLIGILAVVYLILAYVSQAFLEAAVFSVTLPSGAVWVLTVADLLIVAGIVLLYMEVLKSTRTTRASVADH